MTTRNCSECGEAISEARLKARPSADLCLKCQEREEAETSEDWARRMTSGGYLNMGHIHKRWMDKAERSTGDWLTPPAEVKHG